MQMRNGLARGRTGVKADVVTVRMELSIERFLDRGDGAPNFGLLERACFEVRFEMAPRRDEGMPARHRILVAEGHDEVGLPDDLAIAENAEGAPAPHAHLVRIHRPSWRKSLRTGVAGSR
jgi:hypothetical protein